MRLALDTNLLAYAEGVNGATSQTAALDVISRLPGRSTVIPVQVLGELFNVLVRKRGYSRVEAHHSVLAWRDDYAAAETSLETLVSAIDLSTIHQLSIWDAIVLTVAANEGCQLLLSEDLQEGFAWRGVTVVNPFALTWHPLLQAALSNSGPPTDAIMIEE